MAKEQTKVLLLIFDGANTLDVNGPLEVLCNYALRQKVDGNLNWCPFHITIASNNKATIKAYEFIGLDASISFQDALVNIKNKTYDVLITPGYAGSPSPIDIMIANNDPIFDVIKAYFAMDSTDKERWIISICVGACLYARAGVFDGQVLTTHWGAVQSGAIEKYSDGKAKAIRERWVQGPTVNGIRILSSGGISCGIDAMLYFLSQQKSIGLDGAQDVAHMMDYVWNGGPPQPPNKAITVQTSPQQSSEQC